MAENGATGSKPNILVLGGVGFIGRNLVHYLVSNELAAKIRVVDKVRPPMAWLNSEHEKSFSKVEFKHANLINAKSVANAFNTADGSSFDFVINCAAETKLGHTEAVYREGVYKLSCNCARESAARKVRRYIEVSTALIHSSDKKPITEDVSCEPWTQLGRNKVMVEKELQTMIDLDYVIVRPAMVYGLGDRASLAPRLVIGGIYKHINEKMKLMWTNDFRVNTVHVVDVARALWHLCNHGTRGEIYHLADKGNTTQGTIGKIISEIFNVNYDFVGTVVSTMAQLNLTEAVDEINEKHVVPWGELCVANGISSTPLSPYVHEELILNKQVCVNGTKIEKTGFQYIWPSLTVEAGREIIHDYARLNLFPRILLSSSS